MKIHDTLGKGALLLCLGLLSGPVLVPGDARAVELRVTTPPATVSVQLKEAIQKNHLDNFDSRPKTLVEMRTFEEEARPQIEQLVRELAERFKVEINPLEMAGVKVYMVTPREILPDYKDKILMHLHGGGFTLFGGLWGVGEAVYMAHYAGIKCISVDYRLAPEHPYPAALDDAMAVYKQLLQTRSSDKVGVFGSSAGGNLALALMMRCKLEGVHLPRVLLLGSPWSDLSKTGDTYFTNEGVDNSIVSYEGWVEESAKAYAGDAPIKDPLLSPVYGSYEEFPPTMLVSGTRDLFLSNTVRVHSILRDLDQPTDLLVYEGQSHVQYLESITAPETAFHFDEMQKFLSRYMR